MGGDHSCPVCSATFTRPQHVVRHMRSHTGDRPYKCQHCGDQFSRSDLLSRHVNKCHASGSSSASGARGSTGTSGPSRRKGLGPNATRATTSKQACDQCVQNSLPCDGCNPCAKCIQRKIRCTFVKFHRQTAPIGPGHNPTRVPSSDASSLSSSHPSSTSFLAHTVNPSAPTFGGSYRSYDISGGAGGSADDEALVLQPAPDNSTSTYTNIYNPRTQQQQAELHRRASLPSFPVSGQPWIAGWPVDAQDSNASPLAPFVDAASQSAFDGVADYKEQPFTLRHPHSQQLHASFPASVESFSNSSSSSSNHDYRGESDTASDISSSNPPSRPGTSSSFALSRPPSENSHHTDGAGSQGHEPHHEISNAGFSSAFGLMSLDDAAVLAGLASDGVEFFQRLDRLETQGQALLASGAQPGVDNANAGLRTNETNLRSTGDPDATPMPIGEAQAMGLAGPTASSSSSSSHPSQQQRGSLRTRSSTGGPVHGRTFSPHHPHSPSSLAEFATPGSTSKDAETRELRDFWKAYMRTPLTGPVGSPGMHGMGTGGHGMLSPSHTSSTYSGSGNSYRRHRVSSLPSAKTPTALNDEQRFGNGAGTVGFNGYHDVGAYGQAPGAVSTSHQLQHQVSSHPHRGQAPVAEGAPPPPPPAPSHMSTIHGNAEDLRSYEAAVLAHARTAPVNLNLSMQGKRRNKPNRFSAMGVDDSLSGGGATSSPASNPLSSLAKSQLLSATPLNASTRGAGTKTKPRLSQTPESGSPISFTSGEEESSDSGSGEALVGASTASRRFSRPSYKRLASQNLEKGGSGKVARV